MTTADKIAALPEMPKEPKPDDYALACEFVLAYAKWRVDLGVSYRAYLSLALEVLDESIWCMAHEPTRKEARLLVEAMKELR